MLRTPLFLQHMGDGEWVNDAMGWEGGNPPRVFRSGRYLLLVWETALLVLVFLLFVFPRFLVVFGWAHGLVCIALALLLHGGLCHRRCGTGPSAAVPDVWCGWA